MEDSVQLLLNKLVGMALEHNIDIAPQRHLREPPCPVHFRPIRYGHDGRFQAWVINVSQRLHNFEIDFQPIFFPGLHRKNTRLFSGTARAEPWLWLRKKSLDDLAFSVRPKFKDSILEYSPLPAIP